MLAYPPLNILAFIGGTAAALSPHLIRSEGVEWGPCSDVFLSPLPIECGILTVPLDYANFNSSETLNLELLKVPALNGPSKGSIIFNFGGPGLGTRISLAERANLLQAVTGGNHDLITWDPRGTVNTTTFKCRTGAFGQLQYIPGPPGNSSDHLATGHQWASATAWANTCYLNPESRETGSLIGTAYTVRDMMKVVDALEEDGLLRYFGTSYGTVIGATAAAMFPERMEKVVLDGVVNPHEWYHEHEFEQSADADEIILEIFRACLERPEKCALARGSATAESLHEKFLDLVAESKLRPLVLGTTSWDHANIITVLRPALYNPQLWPAFASWVDGLFARNETKTIEAVLEMTGSSASIGEADDSAWGIQCIDKLPRTDNLDDLLPIIDRLVGGSRSLGYYGIAPQLLCTQWRIEARETYKGDFKVKTKNPLLIFSNTLDPATPLRSAQNVSETFEGSVLLRSEGLGHGWRTHPSLCVAKAFQKYFDQGLLPEPGTKCKTDFAPFDVTNTSWDELLPELGFKSVAQRRIYSFD
ncbi:TAP-like protein-domain-containing protein [Colletotrichum cereale]|nr:TAP-like protein-domain-containing protein [Colletotrichum cereale]